MKKTTKPKSLTLSEETFRKLSEAASQLVRGGEDFPPPPPRAHIINGG